MDRKPQTTTCQVQFINLKFDSILGTAGTGFKQDHLRVTIDSRQKNAKPTALKPQRTLAFERETKVKAASKTSRTKSHGISATLGLKPQVTLAADSAWAMESMQ